MSSGTFFSFCPDFICHCQRVNYAFLVCVCVRCVFSFHTYIWLMVQPGRRISRPEIIASVYLVFHICCWEVRCHSDFNPFYRAYFCSLIWLFFLFMQAFKGSLYPWHCKISLLLVSAIFLYSLCLALSEPFLSFGANHFLYYFFW